MVTEMSVLDIIRGQSGTDISSICECRYCGEQLPEDAEKCLNCGTQEIAHYKFDH